jgi:hypothetical protein
MVPDVCITAQKLRKPFYTDQYIMDLVQSVTTNYKLRWPFNISISIWHAYFLVLYNIYDQNDKRIKNLYGYLSFCGEVPTYGDAKIIFL